MIIKSVRIRNFRSIKDVTLECDNLTALLGRNGSGKSAFLCAIDIFYKIAASVSEEDFYNRDLGSKIEINVTYGDLRREEESEFSTFVKNGNLIVTKVISYDSGVIQKYYTATPQIPKFAAIRAMKGKAERVTAWKELVDAGGLSGLAGSARSADQVDQFMAEYEAQHPELLEPVEREVEFFGPKNIGGKLDKFTKFVLVPAVREAMDEAAGKKGAISQLLDMIVLRKVSARKDIQDFKADFERKIKELFSSKNLTELPELGTSITQTLAKFAPGSVLNLKWGEVKVPELTPPSAEPTLIEDRFEGTIDRKGHGLQRALILTLLQYLALISGSELSPDVTGGESGNQASTSDAMSLEPDLTLAIEEPELYLHPSRCRYLFEILGELTRNQEAGLGARNQVIYTTHSPYFLDLDCFDNVRVVRKVADDEPVPHSIVTHFTLEQAKNELAKACNVEPAKFTCGGFRARAMSVMNTIVNEGFFGDVVVIVEGQCELGVLWALQEILSKDWLKLGIAIVPAGGKNNVDRPTVVFRGLDIPTYFVFDGDAHLTGKDERENAIKCNHRYLRLAGVKAEDFPKTQVHSKWAVFEKNLEATFQEELGDRDFRSIRGAVATELGYDEESRVLKNIEGASRFVEYAYEKGKSLPTLEQIVEAVTKLAGESVTQTEN